MSVLILDFETDGLDTKTCQPIEIGVMKTSNDFKTVHENYDSLMWTPSREPISPEIEKITSITMEQLLSSGKNPTAVYEEMCKSLEVDDAVQYVVAYNREYDEAVYNEELKRHHLEMHPQLAWLKNLPWLCAMRDVEANYTKKSWKLSHVAVDSGCIVDGSQLHRAMADVMLTRQLLTAVGATAEQMYEFQQIPWTYLSAKVTPPWEDGGKSSAKAKSFGYTWEKAHGGDKVFAKTWVKRVKKTWLEKELNNTELSVKEIGT